MLKFAVRQFAPCNRHFQAFKNCEFVFPDAPHPPSEVVFQPAPGVDVSGEGGSSCSLSCHFPCDMSMQMVRRVLGTGGIPTERLAAASQASMNHYDSLHRHVFDASELPFWRP